jgi:hypothetical protein
MTPQILPVSGSLLLDESLTNFLFEPYAAWYQIDEAVENIRGKHRHEVQTAMTGFRALLCLMAVAFNVRFLVALRHESNGVAKERLLQARHKKTMRRAA